MASRKVIVAGPVKGKFSTFYKRLKKVNEKSGPFHMVLCTGSFFSSDDDENENHNLVYIAKEYHVEVPIYVLGPISEKQAKFYKPLVADIGVSSLDDGFDIAMNVTYLGKKGVLNTADDLKIVYLSGYESNTSTDYTFTLSQVDELINQCNSIGRIDILLTQSYPYQVNVNSMAGKSNFLNRINDNGSMQVSKLAKFIMPMYHFSSSDKEFYEREPYRNHLIAQEQAKHVTHFVSLAEVGEKSTWLVAYNLIPVKRMNKDQLTKQPDNTTENPYVQIDFQSLRSIKKEPSIFDNGTFFYDQSTRGSRNDNSNHANRRHVQKTRDHSNSDHTSSLDRPIKQDKRELCEEQTNEEASEKRPKFVESSCWFCLGSSQVESYLILSIGDHAYLALAKGGIVENHLLILPIGHYRSIAEIELDGALNELVDEIGRYKNAIIDFYNSKNQVAVFFERNFKSGHLQLQCVAVPRDKAANLKRVLEMECESREYRLNEIVRGSSISDSIQARVPYFYIEFQGRRFFIGIRPNKGFSMQFGRELLCNADILDTPDRVDWRICELDKELVKELVAKMKDEFKSYDFTL